MMHTAGNVNTCTRFVCAERNKELLRTIIREVILGMERPFNVSDLFYRLDKNYGIRNRPLIREVLDELCDSGAVEYYEASDNIWVFDVVKDGI